MARKKQTADEPEIISEARKRINDGISLDAHNREAARNDLRMKVGEDHWLAGNIDYKTERENVGRPAEEFNRLPGLSSQVIGDLRENQPSCKIHPADNQASIDFANYYEGRIRQIEADCNADTIYDTGAQQIADGGFGNWRIVTDYINDQTPDEQTCRIEAIENQFAVVWDPLSQKWDKSDANWVAVLTRIHKDDYDRKYKDSKSPSDFQVGSGGDNWYLADTYTICEYFRREPGKTTKIYRVPGADARISDPEAAAKWEAIKVKYDYMLGKVVSSLPDDILSIWPVLMKEDLARERTIQKNKIVRYLLSGHDVLEDAQEWVSEKYWPIVPIDGKITNVDGKIYRKSVIRDAKGAQKAYNFAWNTTLEDVALSPKAYYWATPKQAKGHEAQWKRAHKTLGPYRLYNPDPEAPGFPAPSPKIQASTAITEIAMRAVDDMRAMTNVFDPSMMQLQPDISGVAAKARITRSGVANFEFIDNVARSKGLTWRILLDILPKIEDTKREVPIRDINGSTSFEKINWPNTSMKEGEPPILMDLANAGNYNVTVTVGPSYPTQRMETFENLSKITQGAPELWGVLGDEIMRNMDYAGAQKMRCRLMATMIAQGKAWLFTQEEIEEVLNKYPQLQAFLQPQEDKMDPLIIAEARKDMAQAMKYVAEAEKTAMETGEVKTRVAQQLIEIVNQLTGQGQEQKGNNEPSKPKGQGGMSK